MVPYILDFHQNIRLILKALSQYQEQPYLLVKTTIVFLDPPKNMRVTLVGYSWNSQGIFLYSIFPGHYFVKLPKILFGIFSQYTGNISRKLSVNIPKTCICPVGKGLHY